MYLDSQTLTASPQLEFSQRGYTGQYAVNYWHESGLQNTAVMSVMLPARDMLGGPQS